MGGILEKGKVKEGSVVKPNIKYQKNVKEIKNLQSNESTNRYQSKPTIIMKDDKIAVHTKAVNLARRFTEQNENDLMMVRTILFFFSNLWIRIKVLGVEVIGCDF